MLDSGCTQHMTGDSRMFNSINENESNRIDSITFGDNSKGKVKGLGKIAISNDLHFQCATSRELELQPIIGRVSSARRGRCFSSTLPSPS